MNPYDQVHELVRAMKESEEVKEYLIIKEEVYKDEKNKALINLRKNDKINEKFSKYSTKILTFSDTKKYNRQRLENKHSMFVYKMLFYDYQ